MTHNPQIKLEAPGKGLPLVDSLMMRFFVGPFVSKRDSVEKSFSNFSKLNKKILERVAPLSFEEIHTPILVPKLKAIEDSSRYWSVAETLEHIEIVGREITSGIVNLAKYKKIPDFEVKIENYKPKGKYKGIDPRPSFQKFNDDVLSELKGLDINLAPPKFFHPWLGPLASQQWLWLLASHSGIHYNQINHIVRLSPNAHL